MGMKLLRCKKSMGWLPDEYLTSIVGFCDRGRFAITKEFTLPCTLMNNGVLFIEGFENAELGEGDYSLAMVRCANCGGEVELVEADPEEILDRIRSREVDMKRASSERRAESNGHEGEDGEGDGGGDAGADAGEVASSDGKPAGPGGDD